MWNTTNQSIKTTCLTFSFQQNTQVNSVEIDDPNGDVSDEIDPFSTLIRVTEVAGLMG
jgi:hypothetical protein